MHDGDVLHVLIIDDEREHAQGLAKAMRDLCRSLGVKVKTHLAWTPKRSLAQIDALRDRPRVFAFCDLFLGNKWTIGQNAADGFGMLRLIRRDLPQARAVMYSAYTTDPDRARALEAGAYDLVTNESLEDTSRGLMRVLAAFAAIDQRVTETKAAEKAEAAEKADIDPMAHLLAKVQTSLLVVDRRGNIWFRNRPNEALAQCEGCVGRVCHREFHPWHCLKLSCPWCPTLECMRLGKSRNRALLLPLRTERDPDVVRLACVQMVSEPLWPLGPERQAECAGAIECSFDKTKEWESKLPIQRIVDLLVSMAGLLVFPDPQPLQINAYAISRNGRSCLGLASCTVKRSDQEKPAIDKDVVVWGQADSSGWEGTPKEPGPAAACRTEDLAGLGESYQFLLQNHPASEAEGAVEAPGVRRGSAQSNQMKDSIPWRASDAADATPSEWKYLLLGEPDNPARPLVLLEVGAPRLPSCLDHCRAGGEAVCDLDLYLVELRKAVNELREERERERKERVPDPPTFHGCDSRKSLWKEVCEATHDLAHHLQIGREQLWWHYRDYVEESNGRGGKMYALLLPDDVANCCDSPYAKHAHKVCPHVDLPPPAEWGPEGTPGQALEDDPKAIKGKTLKSKENDPPSGSWLCRVSGEPILRHVPPSRGGQTNYRRVRQSAKDRNDEDSLRKLDAIQSHGDFPVGTNANPVGTFHVQSTDDDLFIPAVQAYLRSVAKGIERAILRIRAEERRRELEDLRQRQYRERIVRDSISGRLLELSQLVRKLPGTDADATAAPADLVSQKATSLAVLQDLLHGEAPPLRPETTERCDLGELLLKAIERAHAEIAGNPWYGGISPASILQGPESFPACPVRADGRLLLEAVNSLLRFGLRARDCADDRTETRIVVGLEASASGASRATDATGPAAILRLTIQPSPVVEFLDAASGLCSRPGGQNDPLEAFLKERILECQGPGSVRIALIELACALLFARHSLGSGRSEWRVEKCGDGIGVEWHLGGERA